MAAPTRPIRLVVAQCNDQPIVRAGLCSLLESDASIEVAGSAGTRDEALQAIATEKPDIILLDFMTGYHGEIELIAEIVKLPAAPRVVALVAGNDSELHQRAVGAGVLGIVSKSQDPAVMKKAIEKVHAGEIWLERTMTAQALTAMTRDHAGQMRPKDRIATLTDREREVIDLLGQGLKNQDIATRLFVSEAAVRHRLGSIFEKLDVADRLELLIFAYRHGLAELPR